MHLSTGTRALGHASHHARMACVHAVDHRGRRLLADPVGAGRDWLDCLLVGSGSASGASPPAACSRWATVPRSHLRAVLRSTSRAILESLSHAIIVCTGSGENR